MPDFLGTNNLSYNAMGNLSVAGQWAAGIFLSSLTLLRKVPGGIDLRPWPR